MFVSSFASLYSWETSNEILYVKDDHFICHLLLTTAKQHPNQQQSMFSIVMYLFYDDGVIGILCDDERVQDVIPLVEIYCSNIISTFLIRELKYEIIKTESQTCCVDVAKSSETGDDDSVHEDQEEVIHPLNDDQLAGF